MAQKLAPVPSGKVGEHLHFSKKYENIDVLIFPLKNANVRQLRLRPQERVFELGYRFEVRNASSRSELSDFQMFVAARVFFGRNFWQSDVAKNLFFLGNQSTLEGC